MIRKLIIVELISLALKLMPENAKGKFELSIAQLVILGKI